MINVREYILGEFRTIERECYEKGITASEWVERYAEEYHRKYNLNGNMEN